MTTAVASAVALPSHTGGNVGEAVWLLPVGFLLGLSLVSDDFNEEGVAGKLSDAVTTEPSRGNFDIDGPTLGGTRSGIAGFRMGSLPVRAALARV